ncbi:MAG: IS110 family transposase [Actinobacteria bacterium]|nr:IS110 family transposase [Actinomycetota bacterium]
MRDELEVVIGVDAHKRTHTLVACDALGRELGSKTVTATTDGHLAAVDWVRRWTVRRWAVEDCRHLTRTLEGDLLRAGEQLVRVPAQLMAGARRSAREPGKSDPIDALAVARAAWREPRLPAARLDGPARQVRLLVDHRDDLVRERTRVQSRIRWHLHEIAPDLDVPARGLRRRRVVDAVAVHLAELDGAIARIARELLDRIRELNQRVIELEREIKQLIVGLAPSLLDIPGCGALTAAKIVGETAGARRFHSKSAYARWNGTAPQPAWSGNTRRFRLSRGGNRQVNSALHRIAITQARNATPGRAYLDRRIKQGNSRTEALRLLRRRLSDVVYRTLLLDEPAAPSARETALPH